MESNDTQEVTRTFENLWQVVKNRLLSSDLDRDVLAKVIEILDHQYQLEVKTFKPYGICFCKHPDVLQQWLEYGDKTRGVVMGFDLDWFPGLRKQMPHPSSIFLNTIGYEQVLYHDEQIEDGFYKICYEAIKEYGLNAWLNGGIRSTFKHYSAFIKNPTFYGELETRIVYYPDISENIRDNQLGIYGPVNEPFTHFCLHWNRGDGDNALKIIGLGCNCELTQNKLQSILIDAELSGTFQLFKSKCTYRLKK